MPKKLFLLTITIFSAINLISISLPAIAGNAVPKFYPSPLTANTLEGLIGDVTDWVLGIAASVIILFLIIGGIRYVTSAGNEEAIRSAKNIIMYSIVGLFIILLSWSILQEIKSVL